MIHLTILHCNDIYELTPVSGGTLGGLARLATLRRQSRDRNPNTLMTFAGDLYGPSALNPIPVDGQPLGGRAAVAAMNHVGIDCMTFGDSELNTVSRENFDACLEATRFPVISSNIFDCDGQPFSRGTTTVAPHAIFKFSNDEGESMRVGLFGITKPVRLPRFDFAYVEPLQAAARQVEELGDKTDVLIALTHQPLSADRELAARFPAIDVVLGGDDHERVKCVSPPGSAPIYKADSNARSIYAIDLFFDPSTGKLDLQDSVQAVTSALYPDPATEAETERWLDLAFSAMRRAGNDPTRVLALAPIELDCSEATIRRSRTAFTDLITTSMQDQAAGTELAILCSWAVRLDDFIPAGAPVTRYHVMRTFPFGSSPLYAVATPGCLLETILNFGLLGTGSGWWLLTSPNVTRDDAQWRIGAEPLDRSRSYSVAMGEDLLKDTILVIDAAGAARMSVLGVYGDLTQAVIRRIQSEHILAC